MLSRAASSDSARQAKRKIQRLVDDAGYVAVTPQMSLTKHLLQAQSGYRLQPNQLMDDLTRCAAGPHFPGGFGKAARAQLATQKRFELVEACIDVA